MALSRGLEVAALVEVEDRAQAPVDLAARLAQAGVPILAGCAPTLARGGAEGVENLVVRNLADGRARTLTCDTVVQAVSLTPAIELIDVLGAAIAMRPTLGGHAPATPDGTATSLAQVFVAGDVAGVPGGAGGSVDAAQASGARAAEAALASLGRASRTVAPAAAAAAPAFDAVAYQQSWMRALMAVNDASVFVCQCEEVSREALLAVSQPTYLGPPSAPLAGRDLKRLLEDGPPNPDQVKRLTRAGMGVCQARRCREQVALTLACACGERADRMSLASYRAPVRPLPLSVLADRAEGRAMADNWDVWFGIPGQWVPYADAGTDREALYAGILGEG